MTDEEREQKKQEVLAKLEHDYDWYTQKGYTIKFLVLRKDDWSWFESTLSQEIRNEYALSGPPMMDDPRFEGNPPPKAFCLEYRGIPVLAID